MYSENITNVYFAPENKRVLRIQGSCEPGEEFQAWLDGSRLEIGIRRNDFSSDLQKKTAYDYTDTKKLVFDVVLPEGFETARKLKIYAVGNNGKRLYFSEKVSSLKKKETKPLYWLDSVRRDPNGSLAVAGWAVYSSPVKISAEDGSGEKLPMEIRRTRREDVQQKYSVFACDAECGFQVKIPDAGLKKAVLVFTAGDVQERCTIPLGRTEKAAAKISGFIEKVSAGMDPGKIVKLRRRISRHLEAGNETEEYTKWYLSHRPDAEELERQRNTEFAWNPKFSIVVPLYKTPQNFLSALIDSVRNQTYYNWELCFSDGSGADSPLKEFLEKVQKEDSRIRVVSHQEPKQISENTNAAIGIADGDFIVFADHDDELVPESLFACVQVLNEHPELEMIYTDEDKISMEGNEYFQPHFKPDFNYDLLCTQNYICHLCVVKNTLLKKAGLLRSEFDGSQDFDFVLRCAENTTAEKIWHIPQVLYHWRCHSGSTAVNPQSKMYAFDAGKRAVQAHFDRMGIPAETVHSPFLGLYRTIFRPAGHPMVSVIIAAEDHPDLLIRCMDSLQKRNSCRNMEYIIMDCGSSDPRLLKYYDSLQKDSRNVSVIFCGSGSGNAEIRNRAAAEAHGEYLLFMDASCRIVNPDCIEELLGCCRREGIGAAGGKICYEDGTIRHAGVVVGIGGTAGFCFAGAPKDQPGYFGAVYSCQNYSAVSGEGMLVRKSVFEELGGFDERYQYMFYDIDFCLRMNRRGYRAVYTPYGEMCYLDVMPKEGAARLAKKDSVLFADEWKDLIQKGDPFYNPHLTLKNNDFSLKNS